MMNDYRRPASYQIEHVYRCRKCGHEQHVRSGESAAMPCYHCRGFVEFVGETYPSSSADWHEERDSVNDAWRNPYTRG